MTNVPRRRPAVALATCAALPDLDPDDQLLLEPLARAGVDVTAAVWDDPAVDWAAFDLVVLRNTWDYAPRRDRFVAWASTVPALANPADVVAWNTDKRYLRHLAAAGVPVVPTTWIEPGAVWTPPEAGEWVVKPAVSAGSLDTGRYDCASGEHRAFAAGHVTRLQEAGRLVMVQPYLGSVDTYGETALLYLDRGYSHAIRKGPMLRSPPTEGAVLRGPDPGEDVLYLEEEISARTPSPAERSAAEAALRAAPFAPEHLLYARVDLLVDASGEPVVVELELTEPSLFFRAAPGSAARLAAAIARRAAGA